MGGLDHELRLATREATLAFARGLAPLLAQGDVVLLEGELGAGKSELARALIRQRLGAEVEVPSPTYTLVQTYDGPDCPLTHADLYRLTQPDELAELGLEEAGDLGILLVEWPEKARPGYFPPSALLIRIEAGLDAEPEPQVEAGEARRLRLSGDEGWALRLAPLLERG